MRKTRVIVLGGGFAGLYAARYLDKTLTRRTDVKVTLISHDNYILFTPMLHEVAAGDLHPSERMIHILDTTSRSDRAERRSQNRTRTV